MASKPKSRLGKGLAGLISGGAAASKSPPAAKPAAPTKAKPASASGPAAKPANEKANVGFSIGKSAPSPAASMAERRSPDFLEVLVSKVEPNPYQPRREFEPSQLADLAESIRSEGLIQPIVVRAAGEGYQLIAGERRWRAFKLLKLSKIPARIIEAGDASAASMALIENLQRENLNPIEESMGYASLMRDFDLTQEQVAERVGKGRATIANSLRLLGLSEEVRGFLASGILSTGHAKVLLGLPDRQEQTLLARRIIEQGASVRAAEALIESTKRANASKPSAGRDAPAGEIAAIEDIERRMTSYLNTKVALKHTPKKGRIVIDYTGNDDLQRIMEKIGLEE